MDLNKVRWISESRVEMQCEAGWGWLIGTFPGGRKNLAQSFSHCRGQVFFRAAILPLSLLHSVDAPPLTSGILQFKDLCRTTIPQSTWCTIIEVKRIHYVVKLPEIMARFGAILSAERSKFAKKSFQIQHLSMFSFNWLFMESFLVRKKQTGISCLAFYSWTLCTNRQRATIWAE